MGQKYTSFHVKETNTNKTGEVDPAFSLGRPALDECFFLSLVHTLAMSVPFVVKSTFRQFCRHCFANPS
jgi:hypothetical protein